MINTNVLEAAKEYRVPKVVSLLSTCIYPDKVTYPLTEDQIHLGEPHESNFGYAYAKRMLDAHSRAIRQQYGLNYVTVVPNNIYGPKDKFSESCEVSRCSDNVKASIAAFVTPIPTCGLAVNAASPIVITFLFIC